MSVGGLRDLSERREDIVSWVVDRRREEEYAEDDELF
jgi:hypothetical protein